MAKKKKTKTKKTKIPTISKSQAIRNYMVENPTAGPKATAAALSKPGYKITPAFVSTIKSSDKRNKGFRKPTEEALMEGLVIAKKLSDLMGGVDGARSTIEGYAKLIG